MSRYLAVIPARAGSKRIPGKNMRLLAGKPLIYHTFEAAKKCPKLDACLVTTDDPEIKQLALDFGFEVIDRPEELAGDLTLSSDVVSHVLDELDDQGRHFDHLVLLQPTSPLRNAPHISACIEGFEGGPHAAAISVCSAEHHPYKMFKRGEGGELTPFQSAELLQQPYQSLPRVYRQNGAIYVIKTEIFRKQEHFFAEPCFAYEMDHAVSIDIDEEWDFQMAEFYCSQQKSS